MRIYIACGLTHVPRSEFYVYTNFIKDSARRLANFPSIEVKYALRDSDPNLAQWPNSERASLCYQWDKAMVEWADLVIAEASYPSTGLGIELQIACARGTPIFLLFKLDEGHRAQSVDYRTPDDGLHALQIGEGYVSLMALGLPTIQRVLPYSDTERAFEELATAVQAL